MRTSFVRRATQLTMLLHWTPLSLTRIRKRKAMTMKVMRLNVTKSLGLLLPSFPSLIYIQSPFLKRSFQSHYGTAFITQLSFWHKAYQIKHCATCTSHCLMKAVKILDFMVASIQHHRLHGSRPSNLQQCYGFTLVYLLLVIWTPTIKSTCGRWVL